MNSFHARRLLINLWCNIFLHRRYQRQAWLPDVARPVLDVSSVPLRSAGWILCLLQMTSLVIPFTNLLPICYKFLWMSASAYLLHLSNDDDNPVKALKLLSKPLHCTVHSLIYGRSWSAIGQFQLTGNSLWRTRMVLRNVISGSGIWSGAEHFSEICQWRIAPECEKS